MRADKMRQKAKRALQKSALNQLSTSLLLTVNADKLAVVSPTRTSVWKRIMKFIDDERCVYTVYSADVLLTHARVSVCNTCTNTPLAHIHTHVSLA